MARNQDNGLITRRMVDAKEMRKARDAIQQYEVAVRKLLQRSRRRRIDSKKPIQFGTATLVIDWRNPGYWVTRSGQKIAIVDMESTFLYDLVLWAVHTCADLYSYYAGLQAKHFVDASLWLAAQPLFRALAREVACRQLVLPDDIVEFLLVYLVELQKYQDDHDNASPVNELQKLNVFSGPEGQSLRSLLL